mmetsp:Transcript_33036/g.77243  ORF Transcript_33036/g.77243 Transcript_33036/m.77243 type:complete len:242 (-) Transcript_33036:584-1309(-)
MEGVVWLPRVRADHMRGIWEAPRVGMAHHDVDKVHAHVEQVLLLALELEPQSTVDVPNMQLLEQLSRASIIEVGVAKNACIAAHLEGLVDNVIETWAEKLKPSCSRAQRVVQGHTHVRRLDSLCNPIGSMPRPEIRCVWRLLLPLLPCSLLQNVIQWGQLFEELALHVQTNVSPDKVTLWSSHGVRPWCRRSGIRDVATWNTPDIEPVCGLPLLLEQSSRQIILRGTRLLRSRPWNRWHVS